MGSYSWTLPPAPSQVGAGVTEEQKETLLGKDFFFNGDFAVTASGDYVTVSGMEALRQSIYRRLLTRPGEFKLRPNYGVGVLSYVKKRLRNAELEELKGRIIDQLSLEERIDSVQSVTVERSENGVKIGIAVQAAGETLAFRPFDFHPETMIGTI